MSVQQCEECRLALVRVVFDPGAGESDAWSCQLDETFSDQTRDVVCPFFVGWDVTLPPPARSCKKSMGSIDGCSTTASAGCGSCGPNGCGDGGCGMVDAEESLLDVKWDPEAPVEEFAMDDEARALFFGAGDHGHEDHDDHDHDDHKSVPEDHPHPKEPVTSPAPGVKGDPSIPDGHAPDAPDDGFPTEGEKSASCATSCGAMKALDRMGLGRDEDAPVPIPLDD